MPADTVSLTTLRKLARQALGSPVGEWSRIGGWEYLMNHNNSFIRIVFESNDKQSARRQLRDLLETLIRGRTP